MPVEIRELVIKAIVALDWDSKILEQTKENIVCLRLPSNEVIDAYVKEYFRESKNKTLVFDQSKLSSFTVQWRGFTIKVSLVCNELLN
ncbi:MAG: hypothetical protein WKF59_02630 [Chitinophagaceae bacterium]